jgi:cell division protein FtsN
MPKDFTRTRRQPDKRTHVLFHGPSFVAGIILGAFGVLAGAYGPELLEQTPVTKDSPAEPTKPKLTFEFPKLLKENKVVVDPTPYTPPGSVTTTAAVPSVPGPKEFILQAGSFRSVSDAESVRASLLLQDLPVSMVPVTLADGTWYRVVVGPYGLRDDAQATLSKLQEQNLNVILQEKAD